MGKKQSKQTHYHSYDEREILEERRRIAKNIVNFHKSGQYIAHENIIGFIGVKCVNSKKNEIINGIASVIIFIGSKIYVPHAQNDRYKVGGKCWTDKYIINNIEPCNNTPFETFDDCHALWNKYFKYNIGMTIKVDCSQTDENNMPDEACFFYKSKADALAEMNDDDLNTYNIKKPNTKKNVEEEEEDDNEQENEKNDDDNNDEDEEDEYEDDEYEDDEYD